MPHTKETVVPQMIIISLILIEEQFFFLQVSKWFDTGEDEAKIKDIITRNRFRN
jgi:hypothetical protein